MFNTMLLGNTMFRMAGGKHALRLLDIRDQQRESSFQNETDLSYVTTETKHA